jgi:NAD+ diphosphatase
VAHEFCLHCPSCGFSAYPRISPAMMVLIRKGDSILLARHTTTATSRYTALAGFVEPGESIEETVHREVYEEVGLKVGNLQYFGSQPWPFPHSLMVAFTADYVSGDIRVQEDEIADARWFGPGDPMPDIAPRISIAGWLIRANLPMGWTAP